MRLGAEVKHTYTGLNNTYFYAFLYINIINNTL